jgi:hypothetical protein
MSPDYTETVKLKLDSALAVLPSNPMRSRDYINDALSLLTAQADELATLKGEISDLRSGPLVSWSRTLGILGGDEADLGPEIAQQRMDELATLRAEIRGRACEHRMSCIVCTKTAQEPRT